MRYKIFESGLEHLLVEVIQEKTKEFKKIDRKNGVDLVIGNKLEEIYGNYQHPEDKTPDIRQTQHSIIEHFKRKYQWQRHFLGRFKK